MFLGDNFNLQEVFSLEVSKYVEQAKKVVFLENPSEEKIWETKEILARYEEHPFVRAVFDFMQQKGESMVGDLC